VRETRWSEAIAVGSLAGIEIFDAIKRFGDKERCAKSLLKVSVLPNRPSFQIKHTRSGNEPPGST
jgi:hypothetical protein